MRQFLDIGTGLPTVDNAHKVAQRVNLGVPVAVDEFGAVGRKR